MKQADLLGKEIPYMEGRPERVTPIGEEDIQNLLIALNTAKSLEDFLALV